MSIQNNPSALALSTRIKSPAFLAVMAMLTAYALIASLGMTIISKVFPQEITINMMGLSKTVGNIPDRIAGVYLPLMVLFPVSFILEIMLIGWEKSSLNRIINARTASIKLDLACFVLSELQIYNLIKLVLTVGLASILGKWINANLTGVFPLSKELAALPILVQIPIFYMVYTFFDYWDHRFEHTRYLWPFHRFHHSAQDMCMVTTMRQHPGNFIPIFMINVPMAILGASTSAMIWVNIVVTIVGIFQHSNIDTNYGWFGKWLFQSPNQHRQHHILDISNGVGNFSMMPLWDKIFGTWYEVGNQSIEIGVDKPYSQGYTFIGDVLRDYSDFWRGLFGAKVDPYEGFYEKK